LRRIWPRRDLGHANIEILGGRVPLLYLAFPHRRFSSFLSEFDSISLSIVDEVPIQDRRGKI
jgi:hypothetical protein